MKTKKIVPSPHRYEAPRFSVRGRSGQRVTVAVLRNGTPRLVALDGNGLVSPRMVRVLVKRSGVAYEALAAVLPMGEE